MCLEVSEPPILLEIFEIDLPELIAGGSLLEYLPEGGSNLVTADRLPRGILEVVDRVRGDSMCQLSLVEVPGLFSLELQSL